MTRTNVPLPTDEHLRNGKSIYVFRKGDIYRHIKTYKHIENIYI